MAEHQPSSMVGDRVLNAAQERQRLAVLHKQLVISIKFHHSGTLKDLPLEMALQAMMEVWESCNPEQRSSQ